MKKISKTKLTAVAAFAVSAAITPCLAACGPGEGATDPGKYAGVTSTTIYVGNTAATTGAQASIGVPFNYGIQAAFHKYNKDGGFSGKYDGKDVSGLKVALKHYDDGAKIDDTVTYTNRLIEEDEVFAIVGNYGTYAVNVNLDIIKDAGVPMVYAAAGNESMARDKATGNDRFIFPVQPISSTEGSVLIKRAFAAVADGGLAATKVGVISNTEDASRNILKGIQKGSNSLTATQKGNIAYQNVSDTETGYGTAATALKNANCDVIIIAVVADYVKTVSALMDAGFNSSNVKILTSYNNAATAYFDKTEGTGATAVTHFDAQYTDIISAIHTQGWIDITDDPVSGYYFKKEGDLYDYYLAMADTLAAVNPTLYGTLPTIYQTYGVPGFTEDYWEFAEAVYNYSIEVPADLPDAALGFTGFTLTSNAFAMAGYIAGDLFCQGLEALGDKALTRTNYVDAMESATLSLAMADTISYANGQRLGVQAFSLNQLSAPANPDTEKTVSTIISKLSEF